MAQAKPIDVSGPGPSPAKAQTTRLEVHNGPRPTTYDAKPSRRKSPLDLSGIRTLSQGADILAVAIIAWLALALTAGGLLASPVRVALPYMAMPFVLYWGIRAADGYRYPYTEKALRHMTRVAMGGSLACGALLLVSALTGLGGDPAILAGTTGLVWVATLALHANLVALVKSLIRAGALSQNVIIVGATANARKLIEKNQKDRELNIIGIFDDRLARAPRDIAGVPVLGKLDDLLDWDRLPQVDRIIVTVTTQARDRVQTMIERLRFLPNRVVLLLDLDDFNPEGASLAQVANAPAAYVSGAPEDARRAAAKRAFDIFFGTLMLIGFAPIMAIVALLIKLDSPGPVFFRQKRHGFNNQEIRVWKFRSMRPDKKAEDGIIRQVTSDDDRVTKIGRILRKTSIDELPQLLNVLKGEMSLVGPRPHAVGMTTEEVEVHKLVSDYAHRHRVKPGITGWAQINGSRGPVHTAEEVRERVRLDMEYVNRSSLLFDLYVMLMTAPCLLGDSKTDR